MSCRTEGACVGRQAKLLTAFLCYSVCYAAAIYGAEDRVDKLLEELQAPEYAQALDEFDEFPAPPRSVEEYCDDCLSTDKNQHWIAVAGLWSHLRARGLEGVDVGRVQGALAGMLEADDLLVRGTAADAVVLLQEKRRKDLGALVKKGWVRLTLAQALCRRDPQAADRLCMEWWLEGDVFNPDGRSAGFEVWRVYADIWWRSTLAPRQEPSVRLGVEPDTDLDSSSQNRGPDPRWPDRVAAARALGASPRSGRLPEIVTALERAIVDPVWQVRLAAQRALHALHAKHRVAISGMSKALLDVDRPVRQKAVKVLVSMGPEVSLPLVIPALTSKDPLARASAAEVLKEFGPAAAPALNEVLKAMVWRDLVPPKGLKRDYGLVFTYLLARCLEAIAGTEDGAQPGMEKLVQCLQKNAGQLSVLQDFMVPSAKAALAAAGDGEEGAALLMPLLSHGHETIRDIALSGLAGIGPDARCAVPALLQELQKGAGKSNLSESAVLNVLGRIGVATPELVKAVVTRLASRSHGMREVSADVLGMLGRGAAASAPHLIKATRDPISDVRYFALEALGKVDGTSDAGLQAILVQLEHDRHRFVHQAAVRGLLHWDKAVVLPHLLKGLKHARWGVRASCAQGLGQMGGDAKAEVPALQAALSDSDCDVRAAAATALGKLGVSQPEVLASLRGGLEDPRLRVRHAAKAALRDLGVEE